MLAVDATWLLIGAPNIGKSVIFNALTGRQVQVANYAGATVSYHQAQLKQSAQALIDVPGIYGFHAANAAEQLAVDLLNGRLCGPAPACCGADAPEAQARASTGLLMVLDACNLAHGLQLMAQVQQQRPDLPMVLAINRLDLAQERGLQLDLALLAERLGKPLYPLVANMGQGIAELAQGLTAAAQSSEPRLLTQQQQQELLAEVQQQPDWQLSWRDRLGNALVKPWPGLPLALLVLVLSFAWVIGFGKAIRVGLLLPLMNQWLAPNIMAFVQWLLPQGLLQQVLIGDYGVLLKGIEWPFMLVLPYVFSFYLLLALLEDSGYLARLATLTDASLRHLGLSGAGIIPLIMGLGCGIPAILASRSLPSQKQRLILVTLVCFSVPCISQLAAFMALFADQPLGVSLGFFALVLAMVLLLGKLLRAVLPGVEQPTLIEIPDMLRPQFATLMQKLWLRLRGYLKDGALPMLYIIALASLIYELGLLRHVAQWMQPLVVGWLRLPEEAALPLILGIMRRELTVLPMLEMSLHWVQLFTAALVALFYVPCIAIVATLAREFSLRLALAMVLATLVFAFTLAGLAARLLGVFFV